MSPERTSRNLISTLSSKVSLLRILLIVYICGLYLSSNSPEPSVKLVWIYTVESVCLQGSDTLHVYKNAGFACNSASSTDSGYACNLASSTDAGYECNSASSTEMDVVDLLCLLSEGCSSHPDSLAKRRREMQLSCRVFA